MKEVTVWLTDQNASAGYPFVHQVGERVRLQANGCEGTVKNAQFLGEDLPGGAYEIIYHVQTDSGEVVHIPVIALEKI